MKLPRIRPQSALLVLYFGGISLIGSALLSLPIAHVGSPVAYIDALFTSVSAITVTGLFTVNTPEYTRFGQLVILVLIQAGGLGIIAFTTLFLTAAARRLSFSNQSVIQDYYLSEVEHDPRRIVRSILGMTIAVELAGFLLLWPSFAAAGVSDAAWHAAFHAVSAFCNAGFSTFPDSLVSLSERDSIVLVVMGLFVTGGIGFVVLQDLAKSWTNQKRMISSHTRIVLSATAIVISIGAVLFWFFERDGSFLGMPLPDQIVNALFQATTPRTAGFNTVDQAALSAPSRMLTALLMFVGGAPGSISGGVKITTVTLVLLSGLRSPMRAHDIRVFQRQVPERLIARAQNLLVKALLFITLMTTLLITTETLSGTGPARMEVLSFEVISAFSTVGLSIGGTSGLSLLGKLVIIVTMFVGRVGLIQFVMPVQERREARSGRPYADVMIG